MEKFWQALASLLPTGYAWPRNPNSVLMRVMRAMALTHHEHHEFANLTALQWQPHQTITRLAEWEEATGLPDACFGVNQTIETRRKLLLARLRGPVLEYFDSSPASPGAIEGICAWLGYEAIVRYNVPFRVGKRVGERLGKLDGKLWVTIYIKSPAFRVGGSRVGQRLLNGDLNGADLVCYLQRVIAARFSINPIFILR
jgi:uncharacterized protein YmfQ (DUF2313 family)